MSDPAIRAALRAGARARCCGDAACHYEDSGLPCAMVEQTQRDADIIAAFLRAMPVGLPTGGSPTPYRFASAEQRDAWAAAVERAARGDA